MSSSGNPSAGSRVLTIAVRDGAVFEDQCAVAARDDSLRAAVIHLTIEAGRAVSVEPGMPAILAALQIPVVAGLSGRVDDRVLELALAADVRICDAGSSFAMTQPGRGEFPSDGGTQRLPRVIGPGLATDMLLTGRRITAEEALRVGLVTEIVPAGMARDRADEIAADIAAHGQAGGRFTKEAVLKGADMPLESSLRLEADLAILLHTDPERVEGINAFNERRKPDFLLDGPQE
ncbi:MAG: enoyl-CoA hydratase/isomerase family protein [Dehalococcoidia bacterium]|jgi:enoyl-CoA hydratase|nr:enoyl-CoA hydratase/isomerase family protein [Dehalococcoidia bacterium]